MYRWLCCRSGTEFEKISIWHFCLNVFLMAGCLVSLVEHSQGQATALRDGSWYNDRTCVCEKKISFVRGCLLFLEARSMLKHAPSPRSCRAARIAIASLRAPPGPDWVVRLSRRQSDCAAGGRTRQHWQQHWGTTLGKMTAHVRAKRKFVLSEVVCYSWKCIQC